MSSTNKTPNLELNSWIGSDKPERVDFNYDNEVIDRAINDHVTNAIKHITSGERQMWNTPVYVGTYYGNGSATRTISPEAGFDVKYGIIFAEGRPLVSVDFSNTRTRNYFAVFTPGAASHGVSMNDSYELTVRQSAGAESGNVYACFNELGTTYRYILFRDYLA